jgi:hypothetical protein
VCPGLVPIEGIKCQNGEYRKQKGIYDRQVLHNSWITSFSLDGSIVVPPLVVLYTICLDYLRVYLFRGKISICPISREQTYDKSLNLVPINLNQKHQTYYTSKYQLKNVAAASWIKIGIRERWENEVKKHQENANR